MDGMSSRGNFELMPQNTTLSELLSSISEEKPMDFIATNTNSYTEVHVEPSPSHGENNGSSQLSERESVYSPIEDLGSYSSGSDNSRGSWGSLNSSKDEYDHELSAVPVLQHLEIDEQPNFEKETISNSSKKPKLMVSIELSRLGMEEYRGDSFYEGWKHISTRKKLSPQSLMQNNEEIIHPLNIEKNEDETDMIIPLEITSLAQNFQEDTADDLVDDDWKMKDVQTINSIDVNQFSQIWNIVEPFDVVMPVQNQETDIEIEEKMRALHEYSFNEIPQEKIEFIANEETSPKYEQNDRYSKSTIESEISTICLQEQNSDNPEIAENEYCLEEGEISPGKYSSNQERSSPEYEQNDRYSKLLMEPEISNIRLQEQNIDNREIAENEYCLEEGEISPDKYSPNQETTPTINDDVVTGHRRPHWWNSSAIETSEKTAQQEFLLQERVHGDKPWWRNTNRYSFIWSSRQNGNPAFFDQNLPFPQNPRLQYGNPSKLPISEFDLGNASTNSAMVQMSRDASPPYPFRDITNQSKPYVHPERTYTTYNESYGTMSNVNIRNNIFGFPSIPREQETETRLFRASDFRRRKIRTKPLDALEKKVLEMKAIHEQPKVKELPWYEKLPKLEDIQPSLKDSREIIPLFEKLNGRRKSPGSSSTSSEEEEPWYVIMDEIFPLNTSVRFDYE